MLLTVSGIPETGIEEELRLFVEPDLIRLEKDADVTLKASRLGDRVFLNGRIQARASAVCSRCLSRFLLPLDVEFGVEYVPYPEEMEDEQELTSEELEVGFYRDDEIDISDVVREQILLAVPMKPLCRADCNGMCSRCGADLNVTDCGCRAEETDPRLEPLKKIKRSLEGRKK